MKVVKYPLSTTGQTSLAYAGAVVLKIPQGMPHNSCPTRMTESDWPKTRMKTRPMMATYETSMVFFIPIFSEMYPFSRMPRMMPIELALLNAVCHRAVTYPRFSAMDLVIAADDLTWYPPG